ncbi:CsiV family protein [uncultured Umboniibacter sp.]|uniref:CsiV family protein n=1 Tax=uncultured Umboniibacter sp. TaxID=1798917 RepID=UPI002634A084|nr:CsiV family protein [uncultured Umboniibacter sp.]
MRAKICLVALLNAAMLSLPSYGAENWYRVELLVFTQGNQAGINNERWPENPPLSYPLNAIHLQPAAEVTQQLLAERLESAWKATEANETSTANSDWDTALQPATALLPAMSSDEERLSQAASSGQDGAALSASSLEANSALGLDQESIQALTQEPPQQNTVLAIAPSVRDWVSQLYDLWRQNNELSRDLELAQSETEILGDETLLTAPAEPNNDIPQWQSELDEIALLVQHFAEYVPLSEDIFEFPDSRLTANRYRVLHHSAWHQYIPPASNGESLIVLGGRQLGDHFELEGSIRLDRQQRYVHADINLWMSTFELALSDAEVNEHLPPIPPKNIIVDDVDLSLSENLDESSPFNFNGTQSMPSGLVIPSLDESPANSENWVSKQHFSLNTVQRMRSGVQYYVDHPGFGVIIKLTRYEDRQELMDLLLPTLVSDSELND